MTAYRAATAQPNETVVSLRDVSKSFGSVDALKGVSLDISGGEVHILLGENGAGKSTLVNVILGAVTADSGVLEVKGRRTAHQTPAQAREQGINAVLQDFSLAPALKVYENLFLGREITGKGLLKKAEMRRQAIRDLAQLGVAIDVDIPVGRLSRPEQQVVEIVRALGGKPGALLLDEPTATLNQEESERLFALIDRMKAQGWGLLYITHRLGEVRRLGDRVTVLRDGAVVATHLIGDVSDDQLIQEMVGRRMDRLYPQISHNPTWRRCGRTVSIPSTAGCGMRASLSAAARLSASRVLWAPENPNSFAPALGSPNSPAARSISAELPSAADAAGDACAWPCLSAAGPA